MKRFVPYILVATFALLLSHAIWRPASHVRADSTGLVAVVDGWNIASVASGANVLTTNVKTSQAASAIRITVVLGSSVPFGIYETDGTHSFSSYLNGGTALTAGCYYTFVIGARYSGAIGGRTQSGAGGATVTVGNVSGTTPNAHNFFVGGPTTVNVLREEEVVGGVD